MNKNGSILTFAQIFWSAFRHMSYRKTTPPNWQQHLGAIAKHPKCSFFVFFLLSTYYQPWKKYCAAVHVPHTSEPFTHNSCPFYDECVRLDTHSADLLQQKQENILNEEKR